MTTNAIKNLLPLEFKRAARKALAGHYSVIGYGYNQHIAFVNASTPVKWVDGNQPPKLVGKPYWKNTIKNGPNFARTLYTHSTMRIVVGIDWNPKSL